VSFGGIIAKNKEIYWRRTIKKTYW